MTAPRASVLVCTHNRAALLDGCLASILADRSQVAREVVVVDNGSSDATPDIVRALGSEARYPVRYIAEPRVGTAYARNAAVRHARGELLLFADADVLVCDGWADALVAGFDDEGVAVVSGRILPAWPFPPPAWLDGEQTAVLNPRDFGDKSRPLGPDECHCIGAANLGVRANLVKAQTAPFDPRLGPRGRIRMGGEETHLINKLRAVGAVVYRADAVVQHRIEPERVDLEWVRRAHFHLGIGMARQARIERRLPLPPRKRVYWAVRSYRHAQRLRSRNEAGIRGGPETWEEFFAYIRAGFDLEMLLGRSPRLSDWLVRHGV